MKGELVATTGLRVGRGSEVSDPVSADLPVFREREQVLIPGSSLRGALRSHAERVLRALEPEFGNGRGACDPFGKDSCVTAEQHRKWVEEFRTRRDAGERLAQAVYSASCRVCRVFGSPWLSSRLRVADLPPASDQVHAYVRDGVAIHRDRGTVENKYDYEVVPRTTAFHLEIWAENLEPAEEGLLFFLLGELAAGNIQLGGFRSRGLGGVELRDWQVERQGGDRDALLAFLRSGTGQMVDEAYQGERLATFWESVGGA